MKGKRQFLQQAQLNFERRMVVRQAIWRNLELIGSSSMYAHPQKNKILALQWLSISH
jgi:hypothetical protein